MAYLLKLFQPHVCTVLELAKYLFYNPGLPRNGSRKFLGSSQYNRFMRIFNTVIYDNEEKFSHLRVELGNLGSN